MTRETAGRCLKRAVWDSCSRGDDTWNYQEVAEESRVGLLQQRWWHVRLPGSGWRELCGTHAAEVKTRETAGRWLKRAVSLPWSFSIFLILYFSLSLFLILTTFAINIRQHTSSSIYGLPDSSWQSLGRFLSCNGHGQPQTPSTPIT